MNKNKRSDKRTKQYHKKHYSSIPKQLKHPSKFENQVKIATFRPQPNTQEINAKH